MTTFDGRKYKARRNTGSYIDRFAKAKRNGYDGGFRKWMKERKSDE